VIKTDQVGSCFVAYRAVHSVDRWKLHASWKKLGVVIFFSFISTVVKKSCLEQKNARSRFKTVELHEIWSVDSRENY